MFLSDEVANLMQAFGKETLCKVQADNNDMEHLEVGNKYSFLSPLSLEFLTENICHSDTLHNDRCVCMHIA